MRNNPIQFSVTREDPEIEREVLLNKHPQRILTIGSGGCTALDLQLAFPETHFTIVEPNHSQIQLVKQKMRALQESPPSKRLKDFNIATSSWNPLDFQSPDNTPGLSNSGNFESLFRGLRNFIFDFILPHDTVRELFEEGSPNSLKDVDTLLFQNPYWSVGFELFLSNSLLNTMFGEDATQHAPVGSYPAYFQSLFERGLKADGAINNYFLHHVLLGYYIDRPEALPTFLTELAPTYHFEFREIFMDGVDDIESYDMIGLSNICDWMPPAAVSELMTTLAREMKPGSSIIYRQLNNEGDIEALLGDQFSFDPLRNAALVQKDRSLFYSSIHVGEKRK